MLATQGTSSELGVSTRLSRFSKQQRPNAIELPSWLPAVSDTASRYRTHQPIEIVKSELGRPAH